MVEVEILVLAGTKLKKYLITSLITQITLIQENTNCIITNIKESIKRQPTTTTKQSNINK